MERRLVVLALVSFNLILVALTSTVFQGDLAFDLIVTALLVLEIFVLILFLIRRRA